MASNRLFKRSPLLQDSSALCMAEAAPRNEIIITTLINEITGQEEITGQSIALIRWNRAALHDAQREKSLRAIARYLEPIPSYSVFIKPNKRFSLPIVKQFLRLPQVSPNAPNQAPALSLAAA